jgi:hypothetical protein
MPSSRRAVAPSDASWIAAIHTSPDGHVGPSGAGVVISPTRVVTCAHVVTAHKDNGVWVSFPKADDGTVSRWHAQVEWTTDPSDTSADLAILRLEDRPLPTVRPAKVSLQSPKKLISRRWWAFGFPATSSLGSAADGTVGAELSYGWIRLDTQSRYHVEHGFSGGGLWVSGCGVVALIGQARYAAVEGGTTGDGLALTLHRADELLRRSATGPAGAGGLKAISSVGNAAVRRRRWTTAVGTTAALALLAAGTATAVWIRKQPDTSRVLPGHSPSTDPASPSSIRMTSPASAVPPAPATHDGAPTVLPAADGCSERLVLPLQPWNGTAGAPPAIYLSSCIEKRPRESNHDAATRAVLRIETPAASPLRGTVRWRVELHNCHTGKGEITTPAGTSKDPYRKEDIQIKTGESPILSTNWYPFEGQWFGQGRVESLEVTDEHGARWTGGDALAKMQC